MLLSEHGNIVPVSMPWQVLWNLCKPPRASPPGCPVQPFALWILLTSLSSIQEWKSRLVCTQILHTSGGFLSLSLSLHWAQEKTREPDRFVRGSPCLLTACVPLAGVLSFFCSMETLLAQHVFSWQLVYLCTLPFSFPEGPRLLRLKMQEKTMSPLPRCKKKCNTKTESGVTNKSYQLIFENSSLTTDHRGNSKGESV